MKAGLLAEPSGKDMERRNGDRGDIAVVLSYALQNPNVLLPGGLGVAWGLVAEAEKDVGR